MIAPWLTLVALAVLALCPPVAAAAESVEAERELGEKFAFEAAAQLPLVRDPELVGYVDRIGQQIVAALGPHPFTYEFFVVRDPQVNAFAVPGGYVYVHTGLLSRMTRDDELAGVLGHEVAHVHAHHLARQQEAMQLMNYATLLGVIASVIQPAIGAAAIGASAAAQLKYRREFEQEADFLGAGYVRNAGFDPRGMLDFFQKLWEDQRTTPTFLPPYLLSHPLTAARLNSLEAVLRTKQWDAAPRREASDELLLAQLLARVRSQAPQEAVAPYRRAVTEHPDEARARFLLGRALLETGSYQAAREALEGARTLGYSSLDRELGRALFRLRQLEPARELLARAVETNPQDALGLAEYGRVLQALGSTERARDALRRAVEIAPGFDEAQYELGMVAGRAGDQGEGFYHLGTACELRGQYEQALGYFEKAVPQLTDETQLGKAKSEVKRLREFARKSRR